MTDQPITDGAVILDRETLTDLLKQGEATAILYEQAVDGVEHRRIRIVAKDLQTPSNNGLKKPHRIAMVVSLFVAIPLAMALLALFVLAMWRRLVAVFSYPEVWIAIFFVVAAFSIGFLWPVLRSYREVVK